MHEVAQALHLLDELDPWMKKLRQFLMRSILLPLISSEANIKFDGESGSSMEVAVKLKSRKPHYSVVLENLTKVRHSAGCHFVLSLVTHFFTLFYIFTVF